MARGELGVFLCCSVRFTRYKVQYVFKSLKQDKASGLDLVGVRMFFAMHGGFN